MMTASDPKVEPAAVKLVKLRSNYGYTAEENFSSTHYLPYLIPFP